MSDQTPKSVKSRAITVRFELPSDLATKLYTLAYVEQVSVRELVKEAVEIYLSTR